MPKEAVTMYLQGLPKVPLFGVITSAPSEYLFSVAEISVPVLRQALDVASARMGYMLLHQDNNLLLRVYPVEVVRGGFWSACGYLVVSEAFARGWVVNTQPNCAVMFYARVQDIPCKHPKHAMTNIWAAEMMLAWLEDDLKQAPLPEEIEDVIVLSERVDAYCRTFAMHLACWEGEITLDHYHPRAPHLFFETVRIYTLPDGSQVLVSHLGCGWEGPMTNR